MASLNLSGDNWIWIMAWRFFCQRHGTCGVDVRLHDFKRQKTTVDGRETLEILHVPQCSMVILVKNKSATPTYPFFLASSTSPWSRSFRESRRVLVTWNNDCLVVRNWEPGLQKPAVFLMDFPWFVLEKTTSSECSYGWSLWMRKDDQPPSSEAAETHWRRNSVVLDLGKGSVGETTLDMYDMYWYVTWK